jgi:hypothetical protein
MDRTVGIVFSLLPPKSRRVMGEDRLEMFGHLWDTVRKRSWWLARSYFFLFFFLARLLENSK